MTFLKTHKNLIENFASLYLLQIANILIPLATLPYLVRVLGVEKFGLVSFAQVFAGFFVMFVDFGFNLSIVREISVHSDDKNKVSEILSTVISIKLLLLTIAFFIYLAIVYFFDKFNNNILLFLYMYGIVIGQGLFPVWFFQGVQKMRYITILNVSVKIIFLVLIFMLIHSSSDYLLFPILLSFGYIAILPFAYYLIFKKLDYSFIVPTVERMVYYVKYSSHFFVSRIAVTTYELGGLFVVGLVSTELVTGYYAIADKLRNAITSLVSPITQVLYPYIAKERNIGLYKKFFKIIMMINILGLSILFVYAPEILHFVFGSSSDMTVLFLRLFVFVILLDVPSRLIGYPLLGAYGYTHYVNYSLVATAIFYLVLLLVLYIFDVMSAKNIAIIYIIATSFELILRGFGVVRYKLWRNNG